MAHLAQTLGGDYVQSMCIGSLVRTNEQEVHLLQLVMDNNRGYQTRLARLNSTRRTWESGHLPLDAINSLADFAYPKLGYRQLDTAAYGKVVVDLSARRSAMRGLRFENILANPLPAYNVVIPGTADMWHERSGPEMARIIFTPKFTKFSEGIKELMAGEALGFAVNEDIAVTLSYNEGKDRIADILFHGKSVGSVAKDGTILLSNKIFQRAALRKKFEV